MIIIKMRGVEMLRHLIILKKKTFKFYVWLILNLTNQCKVTGFLLVKLIQLYT